MITKIERLVYGSQSIVTVITEHVSRGGRSWVGDHGDEPRNQGPETFGIGLLYV